MHPVPELRTSRSAPIIGHSVFDSPSRQEGSANAVPVFNAPIEEIVKANPSKNIVAEQARHTLSKIFAPRGAPSTISSEKFLKSRSSFSPEFIHNEAATRSARVSNFYSETPRFRNDIDLLA